MLAAGILAGKGANIGNLFCTTPKVLKLHETYFWIYQESLSERSTSGGPHPGQEGGALLSPGQGVGPLVYLFRSKILIKSKNMFRGVSGLLELCRIGFQCLLLFQPKFQLPAFPLFMVPCKIRENSHKY